jgi:hypothetical protein
VLTAPKTFFVPQGKSIAPTVKPALLRKNARRCISFFSIVLSVLVCFVVFKDSFFDFTSSLHQLTQSQLVNKRKRTAGGY